MKTNVARVNYDGTESPNGTWWRYGEKCDICGNQYIPDDRLTSGEPNLTEVDACSDCMRKLLDYKIRYEEAIEIFTIEIKGKRIIAYSNIDGNFLKPGMKYIVKRNSGWKLGTCFCVQDGYVMSDPPGEIYSYSAYECRVVKSIEDMA